MPVKMLAAAVTLWVVTQGPGEFPSQPIAEEVARGADIARKAPRPSAAVVLGTSEPRRGLSSLLVPELKEVGWWFNGWSRQPSEWCLWLSPPLISRWLGFLQAREYWPVGVIDARWAKIQSTSLGRLSFVVRLSAYPKQPALDTGEDAPPKVEEMGGVRFILTQGTQTQDLKCIRLASWETKERPELDNYRWWLDIGFGDALASEYEREQVEKPLPLGDYYATWYMVWTDTPPHKPGPFEVRVLSRRKERVAKYKG